MDLSISGKHSNKWDSLRKAKNKKYDEFYTRLEDIESELLSHPDYEKHFKNKVVLCPCDDPEYSNFFVFFKNHFRKLGIKKLITTHYDLAGNPSYKIEWGGERVGDSLVNMIKAPLTGNGDFRSDEVREIMKRYGKDMIIVSNPPFSLFRELISQIRECNNDYILLGNMNAITYKEFFPLLKSNEACIGYNNGSKSFIVSNDFENTSTYIKDGTKYAKFGNICWYTSLDLLKNHEPLPLNNNYIGNERRYPSYDNFDAINCDKVSEIPKDYYGVIGVPVTYLTQYCEDQFEIIGHEHDVGGCGGPGVEHGQFEVNGKGKYKRILIKRIL